MPPASKKQQKMMCAHCKGTGKMKKKVKGLSKEVACEYCKPVQKKAGGTSKPNPSTMGPMGYGSKE